jgi:hypothetical protein
VLHLIRELMGTLVSACAVHVDALARTKIPRFASK